MFFEYSPRLGVASMDTNWIQDDPHIHLGRVPTMVDFDIFGPCMVLPWDPAYGSTYRTDIRRDITLTHHIGLQHLTTPKPGETRLTTRASIRNESSSIANYHRNSGEVSMIITRYF